MMKRAAAFVYTPQQQIRLIEELAPDAGRLVADGVIPGGRHLSMFVWVRYSDKEMTPKDLDNFLAVFDTSVPWMACAFGRGAFDLLAEATFTVTKRAV